MEPLIEIKNISFWYQEQGDGKKILNDISLEIGRGEFVAVVGPNGGGKSTLVRHMNGLLIPQSGSVKVMGLDASDFTHLPVIRQKIGMVFQNPDSQIFASVVEEDVAFGMENLCLPPEEIRKRVDLALEGLNLTQYREHPPQRLSGGQRQKVAIAGIVAMEPECIILDEPTSMLDPKGKKEVWHTVWELNKEKRITAVYVTHDMTEALLADRIVAVAEGQIKYDDAPEGFFGNRELMAEVGIHLPPIKVLAESLKEAGVQLGPGIKDRIQLVEALCQLF